MKKLFLIGLIFLLPISSYAQINTDNVSFEIRYPIPSGDNFINKGFLSDGYSGLFDLGVGYNIIKTNGFGVGLLLNSSMLTFSETDMTLVILSPKIKVEYEVKINKFSIIPQIGIGYSNWRFTAPAILMYDAYGNPVEGEKYKENEYGLTVRGASKFVLNSSKKINWYVQFSYEYTKMNKQDNEFYDSKYNRNVHLLYPGVGMIWNFTKE